MYARLFLICLAATATTACGMFGGNTNTAGMGPAECRAAGARQYLGQAPEPRTIDEARAHAGAMRSRVINPGEMATTDRDPLRLTVEVDGRGRIFRIRCG
jgi:hypothetical protein